MSKAVSEGKKKQIRGRARQVWGRLTHDDRVRLDGKFEKYVGELQEKQDQTQAAAEEAIKQQATVPVK